MDNVIEKLLRAYGECRIAQTSYYFVVLILHGLGMKKKFAVSLCYIRVLYRIE